VTPESGKAKTPPDFRHQLYERYVSSHFRTVHSIDSDQLESYARFYRSTIKQFLPGDKNAHVLEVGCGLGHFLYFLKSEGYVNHHGIDIGREQIEACKQHVTTQVELVEDTKSYLDGHPRKFEAIVFIDVFEHLEESEFFPILDAVKEALTPTGKLIISVPNAACFTSLVTLYGDLTHRRLFSESSLSQLLTCAGFDSVNLYPHEKKVIRSFRSRREKWFWTLRDKAVRWLMSEFYRHLSEGSYPGIQTINILAVASRTADR
jgi:2-polyprenyl-3-methyl-5-hydroxy-6-metoxy-1,4-benzoquinol methylase